MAAKTTLVAARVRSSATTRNADFAQTPEPSGLKEKAARVTQRAQAALRRADASRDAPALRLPPGGRRRAGVVGGPQGPDARSGRPAPRDARRGSSARLSRLRGQHPEGTVRRRQRHRMGSRHVQARRRRRSGRRDRQRQDQVHLAWQEAARRVHAREDQGARGRERRAVAAPQGPRRVLRPEVRSREASGVGQERQDARTTSPRTSAPRRGSRNRRRGSAGDPALRASSAIRLPHPKALMLATLVDKPFDDPDWLFEIKWDGYRALCTIDDGKLSLVSRNGLDMLARFPDLRGARDGLRERSGHGRRRDREPRLARALVVSAPAGVAEETRGGSPTSPSTCSMPTAPICDRNRSRSARRGSSD